MHYDRVDATSKWIKREPQRMPTRQAGRFFARIDLIEDLRWDVDPVIGGFVRI